MRSAGRGARVVPVRAEGAPVPAPAGIGAGFQYAGHRSRITTNVHDAPGLQGHSRNFQGNGL